LLNGQRFILFLISFKTYECNSKQHRRGKCNLVGNS
jgi:hypothetical protein